VTDASDGERDGDGTWHETRIISKIVVAGAVAAAIAVPAAAASASTGFAVQDNGGVLVTGS
jgi:hypothetical protein